MATRGGLNDRQKLFCREYIQDFHKTNAAKRAGYSEKTAYSIGSELLKKPEIKEYLKQLTNEALGTEESTIRYRLLNKWKDWTFDDTGEIQTKDSIRASELLGRATGVLDERTEAKVELTIADISDSERAKRIAELEAKRNAVK